MQHQPLGKVMMRVAFHKLTKPRPTPEVDNQLYGQHSTGLRIQPEHWLPSRPNRPSRASLCRTRGSSPCGGTASP